MSTDENDPTPSSELSPGDAAELLSRIEAITSDGVIDVQETQLLSQWVDDHPQVDMPGMVYFRSILKHVLQDGRITPDELKEVYRAVEKVLHPKLRRGAKERRAAAETTKRLKAREAVGRNAPIASSNCLVAGVAYEARSTTVRTSVMEGSRLALRRQPGNEYDTNAIEVLTDRGSPIGHIPRDEAEFLAPFLDRGCLYSAGVRKLWQGKRHLIPVIDVLVYEPDAAAEGARLAEVSTAVIRRDDREPSLEATSQIPTRPAPGCSGCFGCGSILAAGTGILIYAAILLL